ncbi:hypothetical protein H6G33_36805 [Calothrix sp. FACHB-1219]|uniref:hypothetical protein n=1 Tax=unclassified Calothrix TaxID=2619626 RepID=UPI0016820633|nr:MULTISPECIES: hypothetical protein [unclassified Calothrix]MBD2207941.1 hypothetical protein [Calothrix sp. FACHB-168]MBD2222493.1 hypothetical protein [Calothrix sp. FACHB-1219]
MTLSKLIKPGFFHGLVLFSTFTIVSIPAIVVASENNINQNQQFQVLQTEITQQDLKNIDELVSIAERNSPDILEAKAARGLSRFNDVMSVSFSGTTYGSLDNYQEFYIGVTVNPIRLLTATQESSVLKARLLEVKRQKRVAIVQYYVEYLQARQAAKIAAYQMQKFADDSRVASFNIQPQKQINPIGNADYVAAVTEMLNTNTRERIALEQLAASVGLSPQATTTIINRQ